MKTLAELLEEAAALHRHLCPRQVLGARMGIWAGELLGLELPQSNKRLLTIVDGVAVATNCWVGRRTMRVEDYGKVAATFVDTKSGQAVRMAPHPESRQRAHEYAAGARNRWEAMLHGYQRMPVNELLLARPVQLVKTVAEIVSYAGRRARCARCGEEIVNAREIIQEGILLCRACAGYGYYRCVEPAVAQSSTEPL
jgi:formylmethanofuran dehydrogenase subunit E